MLFRLSYRRLPTYTVVWMMNGVCVIKDRLLHYAHAPQEVQAEKGILQNPN